MSDNRRHYSRVPFQSECKLHINGRDYTAFLCDISLKGALLQLPDDSPLQKGDPCNISISLNSNQLVLHMKSIMVFHDSEMGGFEFHDLDIDTLTHLRRLIELNYGDPDQVKQELFFMATHKQTD